MHPILKRAIKAAHVETVEKAMGRGVGRTPRQIAQRKDKTPAMQRLKSLGLTYGQRVTVSPSDDADTGTVGRALDYKRLNGGPMYANHAAYRSPRVEVSAGKDRSVYALPRFVKPR